MLTASPRAKLDGTSGTAASRAVSAKNGQRTERIISRIDIAFPLPDAATVFFAAPIYGLTASHSGSDLRRMNKFPPWTNTACV